MERTVDAMLRVREVQDSGSLVSDEQDMASICGLQSPSLPSPAGGRLEEEASTEVPPKSEVTSTSLHSI